MGVTPLTFTGTSPYSSDFQSILTRAVGIANIPLQQLENQDVTTLNKKAQLGSLGSAVASLTNAVQTLGILSADQAITATSSDASAVEVSSTGATAPASYTVNSVTSLASAASETSVTGYNDSGADPVSTTLSLNLVIGSQTYPITLTAETNNLVGLQNAINAIPNSGISAAILTTGNGNYLSVTANNLGATTLQLFDGSLDSGTNILTVQNQGTDAVFTLNNLPITRKQNTINDLIPGATLTLKKPSATETSLSLASDPSQLASALQSLATAYNDVVVQVNSQKGASAGVLSGDPILLQIQNTLRQLTSFQGPGDVRNLSDLGIELGSDGSMTFDSTVFSGLSNTGLTSAFQFLGSSLTGFGALAQNLSAISDPITGAISYEQNTLTQADARLQSQIADSADKINAMQKTLLQQLSQADSLITNLNTQQNVLTAAVQSLDYVLYGKPAGS